MQLDIYPTFIVVTPRSKLQAWFDMKVGMLESLDPYGNIYHSPLDVSNREPWSSSLTWILCTAYPNTQHFQCENNKIESQSDSSQF